MKSHFNCKRYHEAFLIPFHKVVKGLYEWHQTVSSTMRTRRHLMGTENNSIIFIPSVLMGTFSVLLSIFDKKVVHQCHPINVLSRTLVQFSSVALSCLLYNVWVFLQSKVGLIDQMSKSTFRVRSLTFKMLRRFLK